MVGYSGGASLFRSPRARDFVSILVSRVRVGQSCFAGLGEPKDAVELLCEPYLAEFLSSKP
jgi:hypothetical protein